MMDSDSVKMNDLQEKEERLSRLEAAVSSKKNAGNEEFSKTISKLQSIIEDMNLNHISDKASLEIQKLTSENVKLQTETAKLQYRILHLLRALEDSDSKGNE